MAQVASVADRVRRMPLHSPVAAVLAGVEVVLRKAQGWEQYAHKGVTLEDELRELSSLIVRWRALELKSWPGLLDARERTYVRKVKSTLILAMMRLACSREFPLRAPSTVLITSCRIRDVRSAL